MATTYLQRIGISFVLTGLVLAVVTVLPTGTVAPAAADDAWQWSYGDLNGDGHRDALRIVRDDIERPDPTVPCRLFYRYGRSDGSLGSQRSTTYGESAGLHYGNCPAFALITDFAGDNDPEITLMWATWEQFSPRWCCDAEGNIEDLNWLVLTNEFTVKNWYEGDEWLGHAGVGDFNADGKDDLWGHDTQHDSLYVAALGSDALGGIPGSYTDTISVCGAADGYYAFGDVDGDGATDVLATQFDWCSDDLPADAYFTFQSGKTGHRVNLARQPSSGDLQPVIRDVNNDQRLDLCGNIWDLQSEPEELLETRCWVNEGGTPAQFSRYVAEPGPTATATATVTATATATATVTATPPPKVTQTAAATVTTTARVSVAPTTSNPASTAAPTAAPTAPPPPQAPTVAARKVKITKVVWNPKGKDTARNANRERVRVRNISGRRLSLSDYVLTATIPGQRRRELLYEFPRTRLAPGASLTVHSGAGQNRPGHRYWFTDTPPAGHLLGNRRGAVTILDGPEHQPLDRARWTSPGSGRMRF